MRNATTCLKNVPSIRRSITVRNMEPSTRRLSEDAKEDTDKEAIETEADEEEENNAQLVVQKRSDFSSISSPVGDGFLNCAKCPSQNEEDFPEHGPPTTYIIEASQDGSCSPYSGFQDNEDRQMQGEERVQQSGGFPAHSDDVGTLANKGCDSEMDLKGCGSEADQMLSMWKIDTELGVAGTSWGLPGGFEGKTQETHTPGRPFICDLCGSGFAKPSALVAHVRSHTGEKPYKCDVCGVGFSVNGNLKAHKRTHTEEKPYKCDICGAGFNESGTLITHKRTHTGEKPYICDICGGGFSQRGNLKAHRRTHAVQTPFKCDVCGAGFAQNAGMIEYKRTEKGEDQYKCHVCGHSQINVKTGAGNKPYKCDVCGAAFCHLSNLKAHKRTHTGEKPYKCDVCTSEFARSGHLKRHKVIHTRDKTKKSKKKAQTEQNNAAK